MKINYYKIIIVTNFYCYFISIIRQLYRVNIISNTSVTCFPFLNRNIYIISCKFLLA